MAYFSNGTEGEVYQSRYCEHCQHGQDDDCAVWLAHFVHQGSGASAADGVLNTLIPREGIVNKQCRVFLPMLPESQAGAGEMGQEVVRPAPRLEMLREGERVRLLARTANHDPRFRVGGTYLVARVNDVVKDPRTGRRETNAKYTVTLADAEGYRECFSSLFACPDPLTTTEQLAGRHTAIRHTTSKAGEALRAMKTDKGEGR
jgi:hypothetical protein